MLEAAEGPSLNEVINIVAKERVSKLDPGEVKDILARNGIKDLDDLVRETLGAIRDDQGVGIAGRSTFVYTHAVYKTSAVFDQDMIRTLQERMNVAHR